MTSKFNRSILWALYAIFIALIWGWSFYEVNFMDRTIKSDVHLNIQNVAQSTKSQVQSLIESSDEVLKTLKFHYERQGPFDKQLLNDYFDSGILNINSFNQAGIVDKDGSYVYSSLKNQKKLDLSDREHYLIHKNGYPYQLFFSKPVLGRASQKWSIQITRKLVNSSGDFNGVAVISIDPKIILSYFEKFNLGESSLIALIDTQGYVRAMKANAHDFVDDSIQRLILPEKWEAHILKEESLRLEFDQVERYYTFERLDNSDLIVLVGVAKGEALAPLNLMRNSQLFWSLLISLLLTAAAIDCDRLLRELLKTNSVLKKNENNAIDLKNFYSQLFKKLSFQYGSQLPKIEQDARYIENQSSDEISLISAQSIADRTSHLNLVTNHALKLESLKNKQIQLNVIQLTLADLIARLNVSPHRFELNLKASFQPNGQVDELQVLQIDVEKLDDILIQTLKYIENSSGFKESFLIGCSTGLDAKHRNSVKFQFPIPIDAIDLDFQHTIDTTVTLMDIDLGDRFDLMFAKFQLQQMQGRMVFSTASSGQGLVSIELPV